MYNPEVNQRTYGPIEAVTLQFSQEDRASLARTAEMFFEPQAKPLHPSTYRLGGKRLFETMIILLGLPFVLPVVLLCAIALWIESGNPFYRQLRLGRNGDRFSIFKLRTMTRDADAVLESYLAADPALRREWDEKQKLANDPRVTRVGAFLRATSLDELPQLWNVLTGEMSFESKVVMVSKDALDPKMKLLQMFTVPERILRV